jgi:hypothetical protein
MINDRFDRVIMTRLYLKVSYAEEEGPQREIWVGEEFPVCHAGGNFGPVNWGHGSCDREYAGANADRVEGSYPRYLPG